MEQRLIEKQELKKSDQCGVNLFTLLYVYNSVYISALECKLLEDQREVELLKAEHEASSSKLSDDPEIIRYWRVHLLHHGCRIFTDGSGFRKSWKNVETALKRESATLSKQSWKNFRGSAITSR